MTFIPAYIDLFKSGEIEKRIKKTESILEKCDCCPHNCQVNRNAGEVGHCHSLNRVIVSSYTLHYGEEPVISGTDGAGNIFFGNCNLRCVFCQNYEISQNWVREINNEISTESLAKIMVELQRKGAHNIGLVSPTHFSVQLLKAINIAIDMGLRLPIIYNSNGYDSVEMLKMFEGIIDVYLPDIKYGSNENAKTYSGINNYFDYSKAAIKEMFRQVGGSLLIENDLVKHGMIIRHLILPNQLAGSENVFKFISEELTPNIHISLMAQYFPANKAIHHKLLNRTILEKEYEEVMDLMDNKYGLGNGWTQEIISNDYYRPDFSDNRKNPFKN